MMWRHRFVQDRWGWELPGGLIDADEEPEQTAVREMAEETGYRAGRIDHLATYEPMVGMMTSEHVVFIGHDPERIGEPTDATEADRIEWVPLSSVPELVASGQIWNSGTLIGLLGSMALEALTQRMWRVLRVNRLWAMQAAPWTVRAFSNIGPRVN